MARTVNRLSARTVATLAKPGRHADGRGLYLYIDATGARRWVFIFRWRGKRTEMGLGSLSDVTLPRAREKAAAARELVSGGLSPIEEKRRTVEEPKAFGEVADELVKALRPGFKSDKHAAQWDKTFHATAKGPGYAEGLMSLPVDGVSTEDVLRVLRPIWLTKPDTAGKVRGRIERVLDAARAKGLRTGENPARWKGHLDHLLSKRPKLTRGHQRSIPYDQAPAFVADLRQRNGIAAIALQFTVLTVVRENEALGALKPEFDLDAKLWIVPGWRMKGTNAPPHRVPLSDAAVDLVRPLLEIAGEDGLVFPGFRPGRPLSNAAMDRVLERMGVNATPHGFRSTFRDWAGDRTAFPRELAEMALAHAVGDETEQAYRRSDALDKRRKLMDAWAAFLERPASSNVVGIKRRS